MLRTLSLLPLLTALPLAAAALDSQRSRVDFVMQQLSAPVGGSFGKVSGDIQLDPRQALPVRADIRVDIASLRLPTAEAVSNARQADWFDSSRYPQARFVSSRIAKDGAGRWQVAGTMTIKGVSREVSAPFSLQQQGNTLLIDGKLPLSRLAFKIGQGDWADTDTVADLVEVRFHLQLPVSPR